MIGEAGMSPMQHKWDNFVTAILLQEAKSSRKTTQETAQEKAPWDLLLLAAFCRDMNPLAMELLKCTSAEFCP